jgi:HD-GYP domain-containing protein (c-di-GMP phosphodiesterase class II)
VKNRLVDRIAGPFMSEELLARTDALSRVYHVLHREPTTPLPAKALEPMDRPATPMGFKGRLRGLLGSRRGDRRLPRPPYQAVAARVARWADSRDAFEPGHADRVTRFCALIGEGLQLTTPEMSALLRAAMLHDIGKVALPVELLHQKVPLEETQTRLIRTHPKRGADLLRALDPDPRVAQTVLYHHERPDGRGYYGRWQGVPRTARALAVAEVYDAMTSSRVAFRLAPEQAADRLMEMRGEALDTDSVEALVSRLRPRARTIPVSSLLPTIPVARRRPTRALTESDPRRRK